MIGGSLMVVSSQGPQGPQAPPAPAIASQVTRGSRVFKASSWVRRLSFSCTRDPAAEEWASYDRKLVIMN